MKKSKLVLATIGACLSFLLIIPLYAALDNKETKSTKGCPGVDPLDHTVLLANPDDCKTFFMCSNGVPILQKCPEGLHFNDRLKVCDWPQNAGCEKAR